MEKILDIINLDNSYFNQDFYKNFKFNVLDLTDIKGVNYFCQKQTLLQIKKECEIIQTKGIKYFGSGNFHYLTYIILDKIREDFSLVLLDNHIEMIQTKYEDVISCGSWLLEVLNKNKYIKEVFIVGISSKYIPLITKKLILDRRIRIISREEIRYWGKNALKKLNPKYKIYITIDKDVFETRYVKTNWDQGTLTPKDFKNIIEIISCNEVLGADICGEENYYGGNIFNTTKIDELKRNNEANYNLIEMIISKLH